MAEATRSNFDAVAFAKMRERLAQVLDALGVDRRCQSIDESLGANSRAFGAASLVRCGLSLMKDGKLTTSGTIMPAAMRSPVARGFMATCIQRHLDPIPASARLVVLLGTTDAYMKGVQSLMRDHFPDYCHLNDVAFQAQGRLWVFAAHPSPANGEFKAWLRGRPDSTSGRKRLLAQQTIGRFAVVPTMPVEPPPPRSEPSPQPTPQARTFYLLTDRDQHQVPVRMKNRDTGRVAFRLSKLGNTKADSIEVEDETTALRLCETGQYLIRVITPGVPGSNALVRPTVKRRIVKS